MCDEYISAWYKELYETEFGPVDVLHAKQDYYKQSEGT